MSDTIDGLRGKSLTEEVSRSLLAVVVLMIGIKANPISFSKPMVNAVPE